MDCAVEGCGGQGGGFGELAERTMARELSQMAFTKPREVVGEVWRVSEKLKCWKGWGERK